MNSGEIIKQIAAETNLKKQDVKAVIEQYLDIVQTEIATNGKFSNPKFGTFSVVARAARKGRNPKTGEPIDIPEKNAVSFRAAPVLVNLCNPED